MERVNPVTGAVWLHFQEAQLLLRFQPKDLPSNKIRWKGYGHVERNLPHCVSKGILLWDVLMSLNKTTQAELETPSSCSRQVSHQAKSCGCKEGLQMRGIG